MKMKSIVACLVILVLCVPAFAAENKKKELMDGVDYGVKVLETKGKAGLDELSPIGLPVLRGMCMLQIWMQL
jgi:hypothetical protein